MAHVTTNSIIVKEHNPVRLEVKASEILSPGHLLERTSTADDVKKNDATGLAGGVMVALENELEGQSISDAYANNDIVQAAVLHSGDRFVGRLANGQNASIGDKLTGAANGEVTAFLPDSSGITLEGRALFSAIEAVNMSDSSGADPDGLIVLEVI